MARKASDGTEFTNGMALRRHERSLPAKPASDMQDDQPKSILDDPKAMQCIDDLKSMGYTADDVTRAMGDDDQQQTDDGSGATQAASLQLPGMQ